MSVGAAVTFKVGTTGTDLQYQWLRNGVVVTGATQASHTLLATPLTEAGTQWAVRVSNSAGTVTSAAALLTVWAAPGIRVLAGAPATTGWAYTPLPMVDGQGEAARFSSIRSLAVGANGTVYVADGGVTVRIVSPTGLVSFGAGHGGGSKDGSADEAQFGGEVGATIPPFSNTCGNSAMSYARQPCMDLAVDAAGVVYVADSRSHALRQMDQSRAVTTLAGQLTGPVSLQSPNWRYPSLQSPMIFPDGNISFVVVDYACFLMNLRNGQMTSKQFTCTQYDSTRNFDTETGLYIVESVIRDPNGLLFIASRQTAIERVSSTAVSTLLAGSLTTKGYVNGAGASARFGRITGMASDSAGNVYVADETNRAVRKITVNGVVSTVAGAWPAGETPPMGALVSSSMIPYSIALDEKRGRILVSDMSAPDSWGKYPTVVLEVQMAP